MDFGLKELVTLSTVTSGRTKLCVIGRCLTSHLIPQSICPDYSSTLFTLCRESLFHSTLHVCWYWSGLLLSGNSAVRSSATFPGLKRQQRVRYLSSTLSMTVRCSTDFFSQILLYNCSISVCQSRFSNVLRFYTNPNWWQTLKRWNPVFSRKREDQSQGHSTATDVYNNTMK